MSAIVNLEADVVELAVMVSDLRFDVTTYVTPLFQYSFHSIANGTRAKRCSALSNPSAPLEPGS